MHKWMEQIQQDHQVAAEIFNEVYSPGYELKHKDTHVLEYVWRCRQAGIVTKDAIDLWTICNWNRVRQQMKRR